MRKLTLLFFQLVFLVLSLLMLRIFTGRLSSTFDTVTENSIGTVFVF